MDADELKLRTQKFALRVMKLAASMPSTIVGRALAGQVVRSGTSVGANYRAACKARSRAEFIAKVGIVEEEADESAFWMELMVADGMMSASSVGPLLDEATQLVKIMAASRRSASRK